MLGAPRPAGSALPTHAVSCLRTLQSRRRCLPAEPGPNINVAVNVVRGVQTDPKRRIWREPCNRGVPYSHISDTTGRFWPVSMIHVHTHLESSVKHRLLDPSSFQAHQTSTELGNKACSGLTAPYAVPAELAAVSRRHSRIHSHCVS